MLALNKYRSKKVDVGPGYSYLGATLWALLQHCLDDNDVHSAKIIMMLSQTFYKLDQTKAERKRARERERDASENDLVSSGNGEEKERKSAEDEDSDFLDAVSEFADARESLSDPLILTLASGADGVGVGSRNGTGHNQSNTKTNFLGSESGNDRSAGGEVDYEETRKIGETGKLEETGKTGKEISLPEGECEEEDSSTRIDQRTYLREELIGHPLWADARFWEQALWQLVMDQLQTIPNEVAWHDMNHVDRERSVKRVQDVIFSQV